MNAQNLVAPPVAYTVDKAVAASGLSRPVIYREIKAGRLRSLRVGTRRLITHADLVAYFADRAAEELAA